MAALALSVLRGIVENGLEMEKSIRLLTPSKLRFLEHFRLDLASLVYFAPVTIYHHARCDAHIRTSRS